MRITFEIDTDPVRSFTSPNDFRVAASFLLHLAGELPDAETPAASEVSNGPTDANGNVDTLIVEMTAIPPPPPPAPISGELLDRAAIALGNAYPPSNVLPFPNAGTAGAPPPPPVPPALSAADAPGAVSAAERPPYTFPTSGATAGTSATAPDVVAPLAVTSVLVKSPSEYDTSGLLWDGRIHQARKGVKKDGTWKIIKGCDPALVQSVVAELSLRKLSPSTTPTRPAAATGSAPPLPAPPVPLPAGQMSLPLPPVESAPNVPVSVPRAAAPLPTPPAPPVGAVSANTGYRELIAKISAATKSGKLDAAGIAKMVQAHGCPSLQALRDMPQLIPLVETDVDVLVLS